MMLDGHIDYLAKTAVYRGGPAYKPKSDKQSDSVADDVKSVFGRMSKRNG